MASQLIAWHAKRSKGASPYLDDPQANKLRMLLIFEAKAVRSRETHLACVPDAGCILRLARCLAKVVQRLSRQRPAAFGVASLDAAPLMAELAAHISRLSELVARLAPAAMAKAGEAVAVAAVTPPTSPTAQQAQQSMRKILQRAQQQAQQAAAPASPTASGGEEAGAASIAGALQGLALHPQGTPIPSPEGQQGGAGGAAAEHSNDSAAVASSLRQAFAAVLSFVDCSLSIPSLAARPDAVCALLAVLRRWLGTADVLRRRGAATQARLVWAATEEQLLHQSASVLAQLR